jgi:hypothetical protein
MIDDISTYLVIINADQILVKIYIPNKSSTRLAGMGLWVFYSKFA